MISELTDGVLHVREYGAVRRRLSNISAVSMALENEIVQGYKPLTNVGPKQWQRIEDRLQHHSIGANELQYEIEQEIEKLQSQGMDGFDEYRIPERAWRIVTQRKGQSKFREMLLESFEGRCAVTRINEPVVLEAAHIQPYGGAWSNVPSNGLLLKSDIHKLFDNGLLAIDPDNYTTIIAPRLRDGQFGLHEGQRIIIPEKDELKPEKEFLKTHLEYALSHW
jgi:predicted restriction endonuclease